ncbi:MAG: SDR family oxidoreductase [Chloroflexi bacterium]|nr:SDR family oxidoreductase [Chloroflexota bacterium]
MKMKGLVALVNGASRGIGAAIAREFGKEGAKVVVVARTAEPGGRFPGTIGEVAAAINEAGGEAVPIQCDSTQEDQVERTVRQTLERYGKIDVVVNNLGVMIVSPVVSTQPRHFLLGLRVNVYAPFLMCHYALPSMMEQRSGSIVNITSGAAWSRNGSNYAATKAALNRYTICLADEVREYNIAVNALDPGPIRTEVAEILQPPDHNWSAYAPPRAMGPPAVFLAVQDAKSFTGQVVRREEFRKTWPPVGNP